MKSRTTPSKDGALVIKVAWRHLDVAASEERVAQGGFKGEFNRRFHKGRKDYRRFIIPSSFLISRRSAASIAKQNGLNVAVMPCSSD
jgi:hypothetical protein